MSSRAAATSLRAALAGERLGRGGGDQLDDRRQAPCRRFPLVPHVLAMGEAGEVTRHAADLDREPQGQPLATVDDVESRPRAAAQRAEAQSALGARQVLDCPPGCTGVLVRVREQGARGGVATRERALRVGEVLRQRPRRLGQSPAGFPERIGRKQEGRDDECGHGAHAGLPDALDRVVVGVPGHDHDEQRRDGDLRVELRTGAQHEPGGEADHEQQRDRCRRDARDRDDADAEQNARDHAEHAPERERERRLRVITYRDQRDDHGEHGPVGAQEPREPPREGGRDGDADRARQLPAGHLEAGVHRANPICDGSAAFRPFGRLGLTKRFLAGRRASLYLRGAASQSRVRGRRGARAETRSPRGEQSGVPVEEVHSSGSPGARSTRQCGSASAARALRRCGRRASRQPDQVERIAGAVHRPVRHAARVVSHAHGRHDRLLPPDAATGPGRDPAGQADADLRLQRHHARPDDHGAARSARRRPADQRAPAGASDARLHARTRPPTCTGRPRCRSTTAMRAM